MMSFVPQSDHRMVTAVFIAQRAEARRTQHESISARCFNPSPARSQHSEEVPAGEKQNVARRRPHAVQYSVSPRGDLLWRFAARAAVAEQLPVRAFRTDLDRTATLVLAVVPLDEVVIDFSRRSKAGQFTCPTRALQWTGKHPRKRQFTQPLTKSSGIALATLGQRQIGDACVLAGQTPGRFTVPGQVNDGKFFAHAVHGYDPSRKLSSPNAAAPTNAARVRMT